VGAPVRGRLFLRSNHEQSRCGVTQ
jgi:hypothetical protein